MFKNKRSKSISNQLATRLIMAVSCLMILLSAIVSIVYTRKYEQESTAIANEYLNNLVSMVATPIWRYDIEHVNDVCTVFANDDFVSYIEVLAGDELFFRSGSKEMIDVAKILDKDIFFQGRQIGKLTLGFTQKRYKEEIKRFIVITILLIVVAIIVIRFLTFSLLVAFLQHPLDVLLSAINSITEGKSPIVSSETSYSEFADIVEKFNGMSVTVKKREDDLSSSNRLLEDEVQLRKDAEFELNKTRQYLANVIDSMPSKIIGINEDICIVNANKAVEQYLSKELSEIIDKPFVEIFPQFKIFINDIENAVKDGIPFEKNKIRCLEGKYFQKGNIINLSSYPLAGIKSKGAVIRIDDVTEQARLEEMMVQTEKMMSVGGLAAGMAHEINNPLGAILQGAQNILRRLSPSFNRNQQSANNIGLDLELLNKYLKERNVLEFLEGIRESAVRASCIVNNMLQFSRKSEPVKANILVSELIEKTIELAANDYDLKRKFDFRHINLVREFSSENISVFCVETEVEQVLLNLFKNAAQAMLDSVDPEITIRTNKDSNYINIEVEDNGPGMDELTRKRIFEPFYTTKPVGVGTGLGLSVSYFIVTQNHGGNMFCDSEPGKGTKFTISLPL